MPWGMMTMAVVVPAWKLRHSVARRSGVRTLADEPGGNSMAAFALDTLDRVARGRPVGVATQPVGGIVQRVFGLGEGFVKTSNGPIIARRCGSVLCSRSRPGHELDRADR